MKNTAVRYTLFFFGMLALVAIACGVPGANIGSGETTAINNPISEAELNARVEEAVSEALAGLGSVDETESAAESPSEVVVSVPGGNLEFQEQLTDLYALVNPSVVHIFNYGEGAEIPIGTGSGFVVDADGYIVTNAHVIAGGERFEVVFPGNERIPAALVGFDVDSDLAVIEAEFLPEDAIPLPLGDSNSVQVGEFVVAIGNPFGQQSSMSLGIVSGLGRTLTSQRVAGNGGFYSLPAVIQTDAPINPGNSGGPLLNLAGEVVGVNSAIRTETGVNSGVGFSIPVNAVHRVVPSLIENGSYTYPFLGISTNDFIDLNRQEDLGLPQTDGVYICSVSDNSPSDDAGLVGASEPTDPQACGELGGDFIVAINGNDVDNFEELISFLVFETEVGQVVELTVIRDGETVVVPVTLGARP